MNRSVAVAVDVLALAVGLTGLAALAAMAQLRVTDADLVAAIGHRPFSLPRTLRLFIVAPYRPLLLGSAGVLAAAVLVRVRAAWPARVAAMTLGALALGASTVTFLGHKEAVRMVLGELHRCACSSECIGCFCACDRSGREAALISPTETATFVFDAAGNVEAHEIEGWGDMIYARRIECVPPAPPDQPCRQK